MKTALGFRSAQTLLNLASSIRGAVFWLILFVKSKSKSNYEFASLIKLYARFARSRGNFQHENIDFLGFKSCKSGFSGSLGATFRCVARRHSLKKSELF